MKMFRNVMMWVFSGFVSFILLVTGMLCLEAVMVGCLEVANRQDTKKEEVISFEPVGENVDCTTEKKEFVGKYGPIVLPLSGKAVEESHYLTTNDPNSVKCESCEIDAHLMRHCAYLKQWGMCNDLNSFYLQKWQKVWTPAEGGGKIGLGARTNWKPSIEEETWQGNMYFAKLPPIGTKFLVCNPKNSKCLVAHFGYEIGPPKKWGVAGLTVESHKYLNSNNETILNFSYLKNQDVKLGPIKCGVK